MKRSYKKLSYKYCAVLILSYSYSTLLVGLSIRDSRGVYRIVQALYYVRGYRPTGTRVEAANPHEKANLMLYPLRRWLSAALASGQSIVAHEYSTSMALG